MYVDILVCIVVVNMFILNMFFILYLESDGCIYILKGTLSGGERFSCNICKNYIFNYNPRVLFNLYSRSMDLCAYMVTVQNEISLLFIRECDLTVTNICRYMFIQPHSHITLHLSISNFFVFFAPFY